MNSFTFPRYRFIFIILIGLICLVIFREYLSFISPTTRQHIKVNKDIHNTTNATNVSPIETKLYQPYEPYHNFSFISVPTQPYQYNLCMITRYRNLAYQLPQWIEYHRLIGIDMIFIADDCSDDNQTTTQFSWLYDKIEYVHFYPHMANCSTTEEHKPQGVELTTMLFKKAKLLCQYVGMLDIDEYLVYDEIIVENTVKQTIDSSLNNTLNHPVTNITTKIIKPLLNESQIPLLLSKSIDLNFVKSDIHPFTFRVPWYLMSSHGLENRPTGLLIESYSDGKSAPKKLIKSFVKSIYVSQWFSPHFPYVYHQFKKVLPGLYNLSVSPFLEPEESISYPSLIDPTKTCQISKHHWYIRHYFLKSWEEYLLQRGSIKYNAEGRLNPWANNPRFIWQQTSKFNDQTCPNFGHDFIQLIIPKLKKQMHESIVKMLPWFVLICQQHNDIQLEKQLYNNTNVNHNHNQESYKTYLKGYPSTNSLHQLPPIKYHIHNQTMVMKKIQFHLLNGQSLTSLCQYVQIK